MSLGDGLEEETVVGHGVINARRRNHESRETAQHAENNDSRENHSPRRTEQHFAGLRDEGAFRAYLLDGHEVNENRADNYVDGGDCYYADGQRARQGTAGIADFAPDFRSVPPTTEGKKGADHGGSQSWRERKRTGALRDERNEVGPGAAMKGERPEGESSEDTEF